MKKSLKVLASATLAFSLFASVAMAAETTTTAPATTTSTTTTVKTSKDFTDLAGLDAALLAKVDALLAKGYMDGKTDTTFDVAGNMTRAEAAKLVAKIFGLTVGTETTSSFKDVDGTDASQAWAIPFIEAAKKAGIIDGMTDTTFAPKDNVTLGQLATLLVKGFGKGSDVKTTTPWYQGYLDVAKAAGIDLGTDGAKLATRADLVVGSYAADLAVQASKTASVSDVKAVGAKKFEVTFNRAVDTAKATFEAKKGSFPANVSKVTWNDAKTVATLEMAANFTKGDYTVKVGGVVDPASTKTVTLEDEKVTKVEFTNDKAPLVNGDSTKVTASFKILNQYGEDVTNAKDTAVTFTTGKGTITLLNDKKMVEIDATSEFRLDEAVFVSALYSDGAANQVFAQANLKVATAPQIAKITVDKVAHKTDSAKTASVANTAGDFVLVVTAVDQYGNAANEALLDGDINVSVSNPSVLTTKTQTVGLITYADFESATPAGYSSAQTVLNLGNSSDLGATNWKSGTATIYMYSKTSGAQASFEVKVADNSKVDTFTLDQPQFAIAGEKIEIPFTAVDQYGKDITSASTLNAAGSFTNFTVSGAGVTGAFEQDYVNNKPKLVLDATGVTASAITSATNVNIYATTSTGKQVTLTVSLQPAKKASVISAVADMDFAIAQGGTTSLEYDDISVYDQYGRTKKLSDFTAAGYSATVALSNANITADKTEVNGTDTAVVFTAPTSVNGATEVTLTLKKSGADVSGSTFKFNITNVKLGEIADYEVADITKVYADNTMTQGVTVKGLLADGTKVALPVPAAESNDYYTVTDATYVDYNNGTVKSKAGINFGSDSEKTYNIVVVTTNKDKVQKTFVKPVVVSNAAPAAAKLELATQNNFTKESDTVASITEANVNALTNAQLITGIKITDQYGKTTSITALDNVILSGWSNSTRTTLATVDAGDSFSVTAISGSQTISFKVIVK